MTLSLEQSYLKRFPTLESIARDLKTELADALQGVKHIDMITVRAKSTQRFLEKANRKEYANPLKDIQDQIGARIVVLYLSDVSIVNAEILKEFRISENKAHEPSNPNQFDYESHHMICAIPLEIREKFETTVEVFELQISTLFQHAWAEANHDLGYKPGDSSTDTESMKKIAWAAAQAWGADKIFDEIYQSRQKIRLVK